MRSKPILCVDFDGVVHSYTSPWVNETTISDPPVPGALRWLWKATEWFNVQIYSSRSKTEDGRSAMRGWMAVHSVAEFGADHPMCGHQDPDVPYPIGFASEKPAAFLTIDDRAICFEGDWNELGESPADLLDFKAWNKRRPLVVHVAPKPDACQHDFQGWRDFPDGNGGEQVCTKCGMGAQHYTLATGA